MNYERSGEKLCSMDEAYDSPCFAIDPPTSFSALPTRTLGCGMRGELNAPNTTKIEAAAIAARVPLSVAQGL